MDTLMQANYPTTLFNMLRSRAQQEHMLLGQILYNATVVDEIMDGRLLIVPDVPYEHFQLTQPDVAKFMDDFIAEVDPTLRVCVLNPRHEQI